ncbi:MULTISPECIES: crotonase/enoyl-CoA hydratase family protein [unclassified Aminobacter]|uniref:crotonase/enoyl-CoA hydratase family protein n=1 Tax=unclassified Aminobacter TaxID=2644704 RepID=UPI0004B0CC2B|nr:MULTISPECIES: crotonase/enoyl-CoA hydratase family protein [unclassified Aminobacter]TWG60666.1 enoyl-CoA hydratase/carnithine racemase [Aminobacter sp. J44]TWH31483.1 enoyl-CoA hydratase/carnithine racemase [Aminobacter sp. J15]
MAFVEYSIEDGIARLTLTRPDKRNAMNDQMLADLEVAVDQAASEALAVVICGEGDHFCAGLDLAEHSLKTAIEGIDGSRNWHRVFQKIRGGRIPYFAALHGAVIGGGLELASVAHVRVADRTAFFALPEGQRGIFVGGGGSVHTSRIMGVPLMTDMMLTGRVLDVDEARQANIVTYVTPAGEALAKATELAKKAATNAPLSNYAVINALPRIRDSGYDEGLFFESMIAAFTQTTPEAHERLRAFLEKRAARIAPKE